MLFVLVPIVVFSVIYYFLVRFLIKSIRETFKGARKEPAVIKRALIFSMIIVLLFITSGLLYILASISREPLAGVGLFFLPFYAVYVGIGGFIISWAIITLYIFFSPKERSTIPKKKLFFHALLSVIILITTVISTYAFVIRQSLLREVESSQISQVRLGEIYTRAMEKHDIGVLQILAKNSQTPVPILEDIYASYSQDLNDGIYYSLGMNKNTPGEILEKLAKSKWSFVRSSVAENPNTPVETLKMLADDTDYSVRLAVTQNPNTPRDTLVGLGLDK